MQDHDMFDFDISTPKLAKPSASEIDAMLAWLSEKGANAEVLQQIEKIKKDSERQPQVETLQDPWRALQSAKDRLANVEVSICSIAVKMDAAKQEYDQLCAAHDDLTDKQDKLTRDVQRLKELALGNGSNDDLSAKVYKYEALIQELQQAAQFGLPGENTPGRRDIYNLIYYGKKEPPQQQPLQQQQQQQQQQEQCPSSHQQPGEVGLKPADDSADFVDRTGFGFGPAKGCKAAPSPYVKESHEDEGKGKGGLPLPTPAGVAAPLGTQAGADAFGSAPAAAKA